MKGLSRNEMKRVVGGVKAPTGGTCCAHYNIGCADVGGPASCANGGTLTLAQAKAQADAMAQQPGSGGASYCCSSCSSLA